MSVKKRKLSEVEETDQVDEHSIEGCQTEHQNKRQKKVPQETVRMITKRLNQTIAKQREKFENEQSLCPPIEGDEMDELLSMIVNTQVYSEEDPLFALLTRNICFVAREQRRIKHAQRLKAKNKLRNVIQRHKTDKVMKRKHREIRKRNLIGKSNTDVVRSKKGKTLKLARYATTEDRYRSSRSIVTTPLHHRSDAQISREQSETVLTSKSRFSVSSLESSCHRTTTKYYSSRGSNSNGPPSKLISVSPKDHKRVPVKLVRRTEETMNNYKHIIRTSDSLVELAAENMRRTRIELMKMASDPETEVFKLVQIVGMAMMERVSYGLAWLADQIRPSYLLRTTSV